MFDDRDTRAQQNSVCRSSAIFVVVDVQRIDADEGGSTADQVLGGIASEKWMLAGRVRVGAPMGIPTRMHEHGPRLYLPCSKGRRVKRPLAAIRCANDNASPLSDCFPRTPTDVTAAALTM